MRILVFSPYYPPHIGGLESHADEFNKYLSQKGVDITVFTPRLPLDTPEEELRHQNVRIYRFPAFELIHNYPVPKFWSRQFWKLLRNAASPRPDILISRTRFFSTSLFALLFSKQKRIPLIHIEHGSDFAKFNSRIKTALGKWYDLLFGRAVLCSADIVIANSLASRAFVKKLSGRDSTVIYRGVEIDATPSSTTSTNTFTKKPEHIIVGFIGRLIDGKGAVDFLRALSAIRRETILGVFIGDGPERKTLERMTKELSLSRNVVFLGHREHSETIALLRSFDIVVNPSYTEGLPTTVIEAALCKKAIIATHVGGTTEIITGDNDGFLVPPGDIKKLQEKITYLVDHPDIRKRFGERAFDAVHGKFDWNVSAEKYLHIFQNILKRES